MNYIVKKDQMELSEHSINTSNLIGTVGNFKNDDFIRALKELTVEEAARIPELVRNVNLAAYFPDFDIPGVFYDTFARKYPGTRHYYDQWAKSEFNKNLTEGYLAMGYLEILAHRPESKEYLDTAEALAIYDGLREVVLAKDNGIQITK